MLQLLIVGTASGNLSAMLIMAVYVHVPRVIEFEKVLDITLLLLEFPLDRRAPMVRQTIAWSFIFLVFSL